MTAVRRFTVSMPTPLVEALDEQLVQNGESRSAVLRRLVEEALLRVEKQEDVERYIRGWQESPQTEEELGWSDIATRERFAELSRSETR